MWLDNFLYIYVYTAMIVCEYILCEYTLAAFQQKYKSTQSFRLCSLLIIEQGQNKASLTLSETVRFSINRVARLLRLWLWTNRATQLIENLCYVYGYCCGKFVWLA